MGLKLRVAIAVACAALAALSFHSYANEVRAEADKVRSEAIAQYGGEVVELVVATKALEAGDVVEASDVKVREWLVDLAPSGAKTDIDDVVGKTVSVPAAKGAPLTTLNFRDANKTADVPSGYVAVAIPVSDKLGVSTEVASGSKVVAYRVTSEGSELVAADAQVLTSPGTTSAATTSAKPMTLAVLPDDVSGVLAASSAGELRLVLPADDVDELPDPAARRAPSEVASEGGDEQ